jgi:heme exporter protein A
MPQSTIYVSPRSLGAPDTRPPAVDAAGLARLFAGTVALADVSLRVGAGRVVALTGPNGAGKTTLLRILATSLRPTFGHASVDGLDVVAHAAEVRARVAFLSHATGLYDDLSARENLRFAATLLGTPDREARIDQALADVGLAEQADARVRAFSAGMRRRVALARVLLGQASLVLLDEPYAALDADGMALVDALIDAWRGVGATVLVASHAAERLHGRADASVELERGVVVAARGAGVEIPAAPPAVVHDGAPSAAGATR